MKTIKKTAMPEVLLATPAGCRVFDAHGDHLELAGRQVGALAPAGHDTLAVLDGHEIWRRSAGAWSRVSKSPLALGCLLSTGKSLYGGGASEAALVRASARAAPRRVPGFDKVPGRGDWFPQGPPLHVRALTQTADGSALLAAVHVGGIPRSTDGGRTWSPTLPIVHDVHEVRAHASLPELVAAASGTGLCISRDAGQSWEVLTDGLPLIDSLAVAVLDDEVLFSIQDGPFAKRAQIWRWKIGPGRRLEPVRDGLPEWLDGKVDTAHIAAAHGRAALLDGFGNLWLSKAGSRGWKRIGTGVGYASALLML